MRHALAFLLNDRAFVKLCGDIMSGRADQLHAALMRLMVGLGPFEAGQEGVVNIDDTPCQSVGQLIRQHLHVAGQHNQLRAGVLNNFQLLLFLRQLVVFVDRNVMIGNALRFNKFAAVLMVGNDGHNLGFQPVHPQLIEQMLQAMVEF